MRTGTQIEQWRTIKKADFLRITSVLRYNKETYTYDNTDRPEDEYHRLKLTIEQWNRFPNVQEKPKITVKISQVASSGLGYWVFTHYVTFPNKPDYSYDISASEEGFDKVVTLFREAGYSIEFLNNYPR